jgi:hypothetical protein
LTEEQTRHVRENLTEEELTIFDILTKPGPELSVQERDEVRYTDQLRAGLRLFALHGFGQSCAYWRVSSFDKPMAGSR